MRKAFFAFCLLLANLFCLLAPVQAASLTAGNIFSSMGGTTTIDQGGAVHSQARSIYSLGGGMTSFQGKKVSLIAADPPGFSAGCSGISWHFGGFSFISMDEIRQLVEAVAQASLGVAVDLAMQTLCPQCYAVMSKLRDISNQMRNAAADACKVAQNFGAMLAKEGKLLPGGATSKCAEVSAEANKTSGWLEAASSGGACGLLSKAEYEVGQAMDQVDSWLKTGATSDGKTPNKETIARNANLTYDALTNMGYKDGVAKDLILSYLGMAIQRDSAVDCKAVFANVKGTAPNQEGSGAVTQAITGTAEAAKSEISSSGEADATTMAGAQQKASTTTSTGADKGAQICYVPPMITGFDEIASSIVCGLKPLDDANRFSAKFYMASMAQPGAFLAKLSNSSLGELCKVSELKANNQNLGANVPAIANMPLITCRDGCLSPQTAKLSELVGDDMAGEYTGVAWMILDALYSGVDAIQKGSAALPPETIKILNSSGYPLYRLLNMAAVYPGMTDELIQAYGGIIALQYVIDTLDRVTRVGSQPTFYAIPTTTSPGEMGRLRENISLMFADTGKIKSQVLRRLNEKRALVDSIVQVNRAVQAEVISRGLGDNSNMAISLRKQQNARDGNK